MDIDNREKHGYRGQGGSRDSHSHFFGADECCIEKTLSESRVPENTL